MRYSPTGSLGTSFGPGWNGMVTTLIDGGDSHFAHATVRDMLDPLNPRIVVAGTLEQGGGYDFASARHFQ